MDINAASLAAINTAFSTAFNERLTGAPTTYARVAMTVSSGTKNQTYPRMLELGGMREWLGDRQVQRIAQDGFTITNRTFENTVAVSADDIADDQVGVYTPIVADLGQTAAELPDELVWERLAAGFDTVGHDGQYFIDTDHPVEGEDGTVGTVSNSGGGSGTAWFLIDTTRMIKPMIFQDREAARITPKTNLTDDNVFNLNEFVWGAKRRCAVGFGAWQLVYGSKQTLNATNYAAARAAMMTMAGNKGRKLNLRPNLLVVPPSLEGAARDILNAEMIATGGTNVWRNTADLHVENRL
jgi:phage major head subunit gpT-like protein